MNISMHQFDSAIASVIFPTGKPRQITDFDRTYNEKLLARFIGFDNQIQGGRL